MLSPPPHTHTQTQFTYHTQRSSHEYEFMNFPAFFCIILKNHHLNENPSLDEDTMNMDLYDVLIDLHKSATKNHYWVIAIHEKA